MGASLLSDLFRSFPFILSPAETTPHSTIEILRLQKNVDTYQAAAREILFKNKKNGKIIPSAAYGNGEWVRDAVWTILGAEDKTLGQEFFTRAFATQQTDGLLPTCRFDDNTLQINDDESTQAFILLGYFLKSRGYKFSGQETASLVKALEYCANHLSEEGLWKTKKTAGFQTWHDTIVFAKDDVPSYTQGVTAVAFEAATKLFPFEAKWQELAKKTREGYQGLYQETPSGENYLPLSKLRPEVVDVSSLFGEFLSQQLFHTPLLTDEMVANTLISFHEVKPVGFKVISTTEGDYLPQDKFEPSALNPPGAYQNGASWFAYDLAALLAGYSHGIDTVKKINDRLEAEFMNKNTSGNATLCEYLETNPESPHFGKAPDNRMGGYSWNIVCRPSLNSLLHHVKENFKMTN